MRIHRITIRNFRGVVDRTLAFEPLGVSVLVGPNEIGKSSIPEGFDALLSLPHDSKSREIQKCKPVGRDVGPEVEAEISLGDYRFVYRKRWLKSAETTLTITQPTNRQLTGRDAHDKVVELLDENLDWPLFQALRYVQGQAVSQHGVTGSSSLMTALDLASSADSAEPDAGNSLIGAIQVEFERYFTPKGGVKTDRKALGEALEGAKDDLEEARRKLVGAESLGRQFTEVCKRLEQFEQQAQDLQVERDSFDDQLRAIADIDSQLTNADNSLQLANSRLNAAVRDVADRESLFSSEADHAEKLQLFAQQLEEALNTLEELNGASRLLKMRVEELQTTVVQARDLETAAREEVERRDANVAVGLLSARVREFELANEMRVNATRILQENELLTPKARKALDGAMSRLVSAQAVRSASQPTLRVEALSELKIEGNGSASTVRIGEAEEWRVDGSLRIVLEDIAKVSVTAPTDREAAEELNEAKENLDKLVMSLGLNAADPKADFEERFAKLSRATYELQVADDRQRAALNDLTPEQLKAKLATATATVEKYGVASSGLDVDEARESHAHLKAKLQAAEDDLRLGQRELDKSEENCNAQRTSLARLEGEHDEASRNSVRAKEALESARERVSDEELRIAVIASQGEVLAATERLQILTAKREDIAPEIVFALVENIDARIQRVESERNENRDRREQLKGQLSQIGANDLGAEVKRLETSVEELTSQFEALERRARAAKVLSDVFSRHRDLARISRAKPFADEVNRLGKFVFGKTASFEVSPTDFTVVSRTVDGETVNFDQLSTGAKEQISVIAALACAILVNPSGVSDDAGAPVILDDVLGFSDPERLKRLGPVFAEAAKSAQIILLTASPDRYESIGEAHFVRL